MSLAPGTRLGAYEITAPIGAGGMGEVYQARDTRLNRDVAIKVLPEAFASDPERLARFKREAHVLASLNHPHIGTIYGLEETSNASALILELVEGQTLADRIAQGPVPLDEALSIAKQICEALEAAHERGIVHRDLKPANIKMTPDGTVKVLDFGLAKAITPDSSGPSQIALTNSPTITSPIALSGIGVLLGTAAYMSPEQARGKLVDKRADIWAFGCVLYEMLTARPAFQGAEVSDVLASVLAREPDWTLLPRNLSPVVAAFIKYCVHKDRTQRVADVQSLRLALSGSFDPPAVVATQKGPNVGRWMPWGLAVLMVLLAAYSLMWRIPGTESQPLPPTRFEIQTPPGHDLFRGAGAQLAVTPDGRTIIYIGVSSTGRALYRRPLNDLTPVVISGSEAIVVAHPVVSPNGTSLAYFENSQVRTIPLTGGTALTIAKGPGSRGITWLDNDYVAFSEPGNPTRISKVSATGGTSIALASPVSGPESRVEYIYPSTSPDGSLLAYTMWFGSLDSAKVAVRSIASGEERVLTAGTMPRFTTTGHLLFARDNALWAVAFNSRTMAVAGDAVRVINNLQINGGGLGLYAVSGGTLAYVPGDRGTQRTLVWVDRNGREEPLGAPAGPYSAPRISPDGSRIVVEKIESAGGDGDVWVWDVARRQFAPLTSEPKAELSPVWTLDSQHIVFRSNRDGGMKLYRQRSDGAQSAVRLTGDNVDWEPLGFTPKGELVVQETFPNTVRRLGVLSIKTAEPFQMLLQGQPVAAAGEVSPDGSWLAYQSNESGQFEVYVRPYPNINDQRWRVSQNGGSEPAWSPDGRELFYVSADGGLMSVPAQKTVGFSSGTGTPVLSARYGRIAGLSGRRQYDVSRDGRRFLVSKESGGMVVVIQNWTEELKQRVPVN